MASAINWFGQAIKCAFNKEIDFDEPSKIKVMLCSALTADQDADVYLADVTKTEVTGTGYTAGGTVLTNAAITYTGATNILKFDADDAIWTSSSISAAYAIIYYNTGSAATSPVMFYIDFGTTLTSSNGTLTVAWGTAGIGTITCS